MSHYSASLNQTEVASLLADLCIRYGFCLPSDEQGKLLANPPQEVIAFVDAVFIAEGINPETSDRNTYRAVRDRVAEAFARCIQQAEYNRLIEGKSSKGHSL
jgi:hypothetical protein